ncbi:prepilin-type N-terminal cleavage/methylation domain-containing protein [Candidatus Gracilibacteria bacterium]|nr:prepilin-type N-terminal cleavage/methylation domain-containing protein [Candidatus Gracilibacteria bacterium]
MDNNKNAFTLVELLVSIIISTLLLGGIFYLISDTILGISTTTRNADFLMDFNNFATIFNSGNMVIVKDVAENSGFDAGYLLNTQGDSGVLVGVVNRDTLTLAVDSDFDIYYPNILGYRVLSESEISQIVGDPTIIETLKFNGDATFPDFYVKDFQMNFYNSGDILDINLKLFPVFNEARIGVDWTEINREDIFEYTLTF